MTPERALFFIGYPRSGHSLVGQILNAHPNVLISHELNAFRLLEHGKLHDRNHLIQRIRRRAAEFEENGAVWSGYSYAMDPVQKRDVTVFGDKKGGVTAEVLSRKPEMLAQMQALVHVPLHLLCITRHPADMAAAHALRTRSPLLAVLHFFLRSAGAIEAHAPYHMRLSELIAAPEARIDDLRQWLGLPPVPEWSARGAQLLRADMGGARHLVHWGARESQALRRLMQSPHLAAYQAEDWGNAPPDAKQVQALHRAMVLADQVPAQFRAEFAQALPGFEAQPGLYRHFGTAQDVMTRYAALFSEEELQTCLDFASRHGCSELFLEALEQIWEDAIRSA